MYTAIKENVILSSLVEICTMLMIWRAKFESWYNIPSTYVVISASQEYAIFILFCENRLEIGNEESLRRIIQFLSYFVKTGF